MEKEGLCKDANKQSTNFLWTAMTNTEDPICKDLCDKLAQCMAYDVYMLNGEHRCGLVGPGISQEMESEYSEKI